MEADFRDCILVLWVVLICKSFYSSAMNDFIYMPLSLLIGTLLAFIFGIRELDMPSGIWIFILLIVDLYSKRKTAISWLSIFCINIEGKSAWIKLPIEAVKKVGDMHIVLDLSC